MLRGPVPPYHLARRQLPPGPGLAARRPGEHLAHQGLPRRLLTGGLLAR